MFICKDDRVAWDDQVVTRENSSHQSSVPTMPAQQSRFDIAPAHHQPGPSRIVRHPALLSLPAILALCLALTDCTSTETAAGTGVDRAQAQFPLFGPDKQKGVDAFIAAVHDLKRPPSQHGPECNAFVSDLIASDKVEVLKPIAAAASAADIANRSGLGRCPSSVLQAPPPPPFMNKARSPVGPRYERYEVYDERAGTTNLKLLTYRSMRSVQSLGPSPTLHGVSTFSRTIDSTTCKGSDVMAETSGRGDGIINEDEGVFLLRWRHVPLVTDLVHQTREGPAATL